MKLVAVSLWDVPLRVRQAAARPLLRRLAEDGGIASLRASVELERAVLAPSTRHYLVPADAVAKVLR